MWDFEAIGKRGHGQGGAEKKVAQDYGWQGHLYPLLDIQTLLGSDGIRRLSRSLCLADTTPIDQEIRARASTHSLVSAIDHFPGGWAKIDEGSTPALRLNIARYKVPHHMG